jgi:hypothetical protein
VYERVYERKRSRPLSWMWTQRNNSKLSVTIQVGEKHSINMDHP